MIRLKEILKLVANEIQRDILRYILGGWSRFSIVQYNNDGSYIKEDYEVKHSPKNSKMFFVYTRDLVERKMYYHGYITNYSEGINYNIAKIPKLKSRECYNEKAIKALMWVIGRVNSLPSRVKIISDGTCARCGRKLTECDIEGIGFCQTCSNRYKIF